VGIIKIDPLQDSSRVPPYLKEHYNTIEQKELFMQRSL